MADDLDELIERSIALPRDSRRENELVRAMRRLEAPRLEGVLVKLVSGGSRCACPVATRAVNDPKLAARILELALVHGGGQSVKEFLQFGITKIGLQRVLTVVVAAAAARPDVRPKAQYYLSHMVERHQLPLLAALASRTIRPLHVREPF